MSCNKIIFTLKHIINVIDVATDWHQELATSDGDKDLDDGKTTLNNNGGAVAPSFFTLEQQWLLSITISTKTTSFKLD
jgi:hypothetical protein